MSEFVFRAPEERGPWEVLAGGEVTGGAAAFGDAVVPPGAPTPALHVHEREDEAMFIIEGVMTLELDGERFEAGPGDLVWLPRGVPHRFANLGTGTVRAVGVITPAGLEGMFREQAEYFATLQGPPDEAYLDELGARYGVTRLGGPLTA